MRNVVRTSRKVDGTKIHQHPALHQISRNRSLILTFEEHTLALERTHRLLDEERVRRRGQHEGREHRAVPIAALQCAGALALPNTAVVVAPLDPQQFPDTRRAAQCGTRICHGVRVGHRILADLVPTVGIRTRFLERRTASRCLGCGRVYRNWKGRIARDRSYRQFQARNAVREGERGDSRRWPNERPETLRYGSLQRPSPARAAGTRQSIATGALAISIAAELLRTSRREIGIV
jgi:hypothetical protein